MLLELVTADHGSLAWVGPTSRLFSKHQNKHNHKCLSCTVSEPRSFITTEKGLWVFEDVCFLLFKEETFVHLPGKFPRDSVSASSLYVSCRRIRAFAAPVSSSSVGKNWRWIVRFAIKPYIKRKRLRYFHGLNKHQVKTTQEKYLLFWNSEIQVT